MPNDMSPTSEPTALPDPLLHRAARYVQRAASLAADPALRQDKSVEALDHLAQMQRDLAQTRLRQTRPLQRAMDAAVRDLSEMEAELKAARAILSEAFVHAIPSAGSEQPLGLVPHGPASTGPVATHPASISRSLVDLEALRPFLSDHALEQAVARHAKQTGQCDVRGVSYANLPLSARLDCAVL